MSIHDPEARGASRRRFPVLAVVATVVAVLLVVAAVSWMATDSADEGGDVGVMSRGGQGDGSGSMALPQGVEQPVRELDHPAPDVTLADADTGEDVPLPEYEAVTLRGRLMVEDGGALPESLTVSAGLRQPSPFFRSITMSAGAQPDFAKAIGLPEDADISGPDKRLRALTRTTPAADGSFEIAAVPMTGAWLHVEDDYLFSRKPVALEPEPDDPELQVLLERGARMVGTLTDGEQPVRGVSPSMQSKIDPFMIFEGAMEVVAVSGEKTAPDGRYTLARVPADTPLVANFSKRGYEVLQEMVPPLAPGTTHTFDGKLIQGATIRGSVRDGDGAPVAGVRLMIQPASMRMSNLDAMGRIQEEKTHTDGEGRFRFRSLAEGSYRVVLAAAGYRVLKTDVIELSTGQDYDGLELLAERGLSIAGQVVDTDGEPVPTAEVRAALRPSMMSMTANVDRQLREDVKVDEQGRFELSGYDEGGLKLWATAKGYLGAHIEVVAGDMDIVLTMEATCSITGIAITLEDAEPLTDYRLMVTPEGGLFDLSRMMDMDDRLRDLPGVQRVRSEDGTFRIDGAPPGTFVLTLMAEGYAKTEVTHVEVVPGKGATGVVILVPEEAKVIGQVVSGRTGQPLQGAVVTSGRTDIMSSISEKISGQTLETVTDEDGRFELGSLGTKPVPLTVRHESHEDLALGERVLQEAEVLDLGVLVMSSGATLYGIVREPNGKPAPGVNVFASTTSGSAFRRTDTDEDGAWRIEGLKAGSYNVTRMDFSLDIGSENPAAFMKDMIFKNVTLEPDEEKRVDLVADAGGTSLEGKVHSTSGPEANAMVWAIREDGPGTLRLGATDKEGVFVIDGLEQGDYLLQVMPETSMAAGAGSQPMAPVSRVVKVGIGPTQRVDIPLPGGRLVGRTVSKRTGETLQGVRVVAERTDEGRPRSTLLDAVGGRVGEAYSDATGTFTFRHLQDGTYDLIAGGKNLLGAGEAGWAATRLEGLSVAESRQGFTVEIELEAGGGIEGQIQDSRGKPLGGIPIWTRDDRTGRWTSLVAETLSSGSGGYEITSLEPGSWTLAAGGTTHALTITRSVDVRREQTATLDIALQEGVEVWLDTSPRPVGQALIQLVGSWGTVPMELSSVESLMGGARDQHTRRLGRILPGTYDLAVTFPGQDTVVQTVTVSGVGGKQTVRIDQPD